MPPPPRKPPCCGGKPTIAPREGTLRIPARTTTLRIPQSAQLSAPNAGRSRGAADAGTSSFGGISRIRPPSSRAAPAADVNKKPSCKTCCQGTGAAQPSSSRNAGAQPRSRLPAPQSQSRISTAGSRTRVPIGQSQNRVPAAQSRIGVSSVQSRIRVPAAQPRTRVPAAQSQAQRVSSKLLAPHECPSVAGNISRAGSSASQQQRNVGSSAARSSPSPYVSPPCQGYRRGQGKPSAVPIDFSLGASADKSALEQQVEKDLLSKASRSLGSPVRSQSSKATVTSPPVIITPRGPVPVTHHVSLERSVKRLPDMEVINRRLVGIKADDRGQANQIELNVQNIEPGGLNESRKGESVIPLHEVVSVTSSITVGPGIRARTNKTVYETTEPEEGSETAGGAVDPGELASMVEEESTQIEKLKNLQPPELKGSAAEEFGLKKRIQKLKLNPESVRRLESSVINPPPCADEPQEEPQPELMAAIMHTEEKGLNMEAAPTNVYSYLFPDQKDDLLIQISSVAPSPLQDVVVPIAVPSDLHAAGVTAEVQNVAENTQSTQQPLPVDNIFTTSVLKSNALPKVNNTAMKGKKTKKTKEKYPLLMSEEPPWEMEDLQPLIQLAGASPANTMTVADISEGHLSSIHHNELENCLEYQLIPEAPTHVSRVQLRGSQKPSWFPGYFMALPNTIKLAKSPSEVLPAAWQAVQPDIFADESFLIVG